MCTSQWGEHENTKSQISGAGDKVDGGGGEGKGVCVCVCVCVYNKHTWKRAASLCLLKLAPADLCVDK